MKKQQEKNLALNKIKEDIYTKIEELNFNEKEKINELLKYILEYDNTKYGINPNNVKSITTLTTDISLNNIKENRNIELSHEERCNATRKQGERCTRKKIKGSMYCGTHNVKYQQQQQNQIYEQYVGSKTCSSSSKYLQEYQNNTDNFEGKQNVEVIAQEIQGIIYYMDKNLNVYNTEDIYKNIVNPRIIAQAIQLGNNVYSIPSLGL